MQDFNRFDELMKELDKDGNGSLSPAEFEQRMAAIQTIMKRPRPAAQPAAPVEFAARYEKMFARRKPLLGDSIAGDLAAFDENGKEFRFETTRGKYTVIVFGCLT